MSTDKLIKALAQRPENRRCFDCGNLGSYSVVPSLAIFVCIDCSGRHIKVCQRAKNLSMSNFSPEEVSALDAGGNAVAASKWLARWKPERDMSRPIPKNFQQIDAWIQAVFLEQRFYSSIPIATAGANQRHSGGGSGAAAAMTDHIPVTPLSDVLGGARGAVKLTVSPALSATPSPSAASPSPTPDICRLPSAPAAHLPPSQPQWQSPPQSQPQSPPQASPGAQASLGTSTSAGPVATKPRPAPLLSPFAASSAVAATAASLEPPTLGFTDNAFGPPQPPGPAFAPPITSVSPQAAVASSPPSLASSMTPSPVPFDPFGAFISAPIIQPVHAAAPAAAGSPEPVTPSPQSRHHPQPHHTSLAIRCPPMPALPPQAGSHSTSSSSSPMESTVKTTAVGAAAWPSRSSPAAAVSAAAGGGAGGFNDDVDWGAFTAAPAAAAPGNSASPPQPPARAQSYPFVTSTSSSPTTQSQPCCPPSLPASSPPSPPQQPQLHPHQALGRCSTAASATNHLSARTSGGGGASSGYASPAQHQQYAPLAPPPRAELPSDLFCEHVIQPSVGLGGPMGMGVGEVRLPMVGPAPMFQPAGMTGRGMGPFALPGQPPAGLAPEMGVEGRTMAPLRMLEAFAYGPQSGGMVPGGIAQGAGAFSFVQMGVALPQASGGASGEPLVPPSRVVGGNPFA